MSGMTHDYVNKKNEIKNHKVYYLFLLYYRKYLSCPWRMSKTPSGILVDFRPWIQILGPQKTNMSYNIYTNISTSKHFGFYSQSLSLREVGHLLF